MFLNTNSRTQFESKVRLDKHQENGSDGTERDQVTDYDVDDASNYQKFNLLGSSEQNNKNNI